MTLYVVVQILSAKFFNIHFTNFDQLFVKSAVKHVLVNIWTL